jgi:hypothetical protein
MTEGLFSIERRFVNVCSVNFWAYTDVVDITICNNYLWSLGTTECGVPGEGWVYMCRVGAGQIMAKSLTGRPAASYW